MVEVDVDDMEHETVRLQVSATLTPAELVKKFRRANNLQGGWSDKGWQLLCSKTNEGWLFDYKLRPNLSLGRLRRTLSRREILVLIWKPAAQPVPEATSMQQANPKQGLAVSDEIAGNATPSPLVGKVQGELQHQGQEDATSYGRILRLKGGGGSPSDGSPFTPPAFSAAELAASPPGEAKRRIWEAMAINADAVGAEVENFMLEVLIQMDNALLIRIISKPGLLCRALSIAKDVGYSESSCDIFRSDSGTRQGLSYDLCNGGVGVHTAIYHGRQVRLHCAVHATNAILQGPFFAADHFHVIAQGVPQLPHDPVSNSEGLFSEEVIQLALAVFQLELRQGGAWIKAIGKDESVFAPCGEASSFLIYENLRIHWTALRRLNGSWWYFDATLPTPMPLAEPCRVFLGRLAEAGSTIFAIVGVGTVSIPNEGDQTLEPHQIRKTVAELQEDVDIRVLEDKRLAALSSIGTSVVPNVTIGESMTTVIQGQDRAVPGTQKLAIGAGNTGAETASDSGAGASESALVQFGVGVVPVTPIHSDNEEGTEMEEVTVTIPGPPLPPPPGLPVPAKETRMETVGVKSGSAPVRPTSDAASPTKIQGTIKKAGKNIGGKPADKSKVGAENTRGQNSSKTSHDTTNASSPVNMSGGKTTCPKDELGGEICAATTAMSGLSLQNPSMNTGSDALFLKLMEQEASLYMEMREAGQALGEKRPQIVPRSQLRTLAEAQDWLKFLGFDPSRNDHWLCLGLVRKFCEGHRQVVENRVRQGSLLVGLGQEIAASEQVKKDIGELLNKLLEAGERCSQDLEKTIAQRREE